MSELTFEQLQAEVSVWTAHNFPDRTRYRALLGIMEEIGELSHAHLKLEQMIRGSTTELRAEAKDAIGDIIVFIADYCTCNGYNLQETIEEVWSEVKKRDWKSNPRDADVVARADTP